MFVYLVEHHFVKLLNMLLDLLGTKITMKVSVKLYYSETLISYFKIPAHHVPLSDSYWARNNLEIMLWYIPLKIFQLELRYCDFSQWLLYLWKSCDCSMKNSVTSMITQLQQSVYCTLNTCGIFDRRKNFKLMVTNWHSYSPNIHMRNC